MSEDKKNYIIFLIDFFEKQWKQKLLQKCTKYKSGTMSCLLNTQ